MDWGYTDTLHGCWMLDPIPAAPSCVLHSSTWLHQMHKAINAWAVCVLVCVRVCVCVCVCVCVSLCFPSLQIQRFKVVQPGAHAAAYKDELFDPRLKRVIVSNFIPALSSSELIPVLLTRCMLGCTELVSNLVLVLLVLLSSSKNSQCKHATTVDQLCVLQLRKHSKISSIFRRNLDAAVHAFVWITAILFSPAWVDIDHNSFKTQQPDFSPHLPKEGIILRL